MSLHADRLIDALHDPSIWPDRPDEVECVETHISWVLLTRDFAWKVKKPVRFSFLDFSSLKQRKHFCEEELRLNRRTAPELYVGVVPICGDARQPTIGGEGEPLEFAVQMRRFENSRQLARIANEGRLRPALIDSLAETIAAFHDTLPPAELDSDYGLPADIRKDALENFATVQRLGEGESESTAAIARLRNWTDAEANRLASFFQRRRQDGFIRECHGDLHLGNIVELDSGPRLFDCLEFNDRFRWIDVISEIAFLLMDLEEHGYEEFARRLLNRYLERTGDYAGLNGLRFYLVYRALVRAKVDLIQLQDDSQTEAQRRLLRREFGGYLSIARHDASAFRTALIIMQGVSGSGKTVFSQQLVESSAAIRIRSDVERKRLFGVSESSRLEGSELASLYSDDASRQTYDRLASLASTVIKAGFPVAIDATFRGPEQRERFRQLAISLGIPYRIVACTAPEEELLARVATRQSAGQDASDAGAQVLQRQLQMETGIEREPPSEVVSVDTTDLQSVHAALTSVCALLE